MTPELPAESSVSEQPLVDPAEAIDALVEDTLVEEISIDGMCGVY